MKYIYKSLKRVVFIFLPIILFFSFLPILGVSESFNDYKASQTERIKRQGKEFSNFTKILNKKWKSYRVSTPKHLSVGLKPKNQPTSNVKPIKLNKPYIKINPPPIKSSYRTFRNHNASVSALKFKFLHKEYLVDMNSKFSAMDLERAINRNDLSKSLAISWDLLNSLSWKKTLKQLQEIAKEQVSDFAMLELVYSLAAASGANYSQNNNSTNVLTWFFMVKLGYKVRMSYQGRRTFIMYASSEKIYGVPSLRLGKDKFYFFKPYGQVNKVKTYSRNIDTHKRKISFTLRQGFLNVTKAQKKMIKFNYAGNNYEITALVYPDEIEFMAKMPQMSASWYLSNNRSETYKSVVSSLKSATKGMSSTNKVQFLLSFVQSLPYMTDNQQFGHEKYFFPAETIALRASDCEDRAILFSTVLKDITGIPSVLIQYSGHMATGILNSRSLFKGDEFTFKRMKFVVADPTYIGAKVGMSQRAHPVKSINKVLEAV